MELHRQGEAKFERPVGTGRSCLEFVWWVIKVTESS